MNYVTNNWKGELKITSNKVILLLLSPHIVFTSLTLIQFDAKYFMILFLKS